MKEDFDKVLEVAVQAKDVNLFGKHAVKIAKKYGVSEKTVYNRFNSTFGCSPREFISKTIEPTTEYLTSLILNTDSSEEVKKTLGLPNRLFVGIYDKHYGVSSYSKAKEKILLSQPMKVRQKPFREDNVSLLMSQYLGDGYYDRVRHALKVSHGIKQAEYLKWKVALIFEGYNKVSTKISIHKHTQGHEYVSWYSGKLGNVDFPEDKKDAVKMLTPIGWLLLYLDDGHYGQDISLTATTEDLAVAMQQELQTYGIQSRINKAGNSSAHNVTMCGGQNSIRFYKNFIEPFIEMIPQCMKYKTKVKI